MSRKEVQERAKSDSGDDTDAGSSGRTAVESLSVLRKKRASLQGSLTKLKNYVDTNIDSMNIFDFETRLSLLKSRFAQIMAIHSQVESSSDKPEKEADKRDELEELYCFIKSKLLSHIAQLKSHSSIASNSPATTLGAQTSLSSRGPTPRYSRLPMLKLPHFSGKYTDWVNFIGTFNTLVHNDTELTNIEKFQHLLNCLGEKPLQTIKDLESTGDNYEQALKLLRGRYENKCIIFQAHIKELLDVPRASKGVSSQLRDIVDLSNAHLRALKTLGSSEDILNGIIVHLIIGKLDPDTISKWDDENSLEDLPSWDKFSTFISKRCTSLECRNINFCNFSKFKPQRPSNKSSTLLLSSSSPNPRCVTCKANCNSLVHSPKFKSMTPLQRFYEAKRFSLCLNCLKKGHSVTTCTSKRCEQCQSPHHSLLHRQSSSTAICSKWKEESNPQGTSNYVVNVPKSVEGLTDAALFVNTSLKVDARSPPIAQKDNLKDEYIILATAVVLVRDSTGSFIPCRALLDSASQRNFVTETLAQRLRLRREQMNGEVEGIGAISTAIKSRIELCVKSRLSEDTFSLSCCVLPVITNTHPSYKVNTGGWSIPQNIELADPSFYEPQKIDLLIGGGIFFELLAVGQIRIGANQPILQKTSLGWVVTGRIRALESSPTLSAILTDKGIEQEYDPLNKMLERFWTIENLSESRSISSLEHEECESYFVNNVQRSLSGRFIVSLPFREDPISLGNSYDGAFRRFLSLERRLNRNLELKMQYSQFLQEYLQMGHMELVDKAELPIRQYYMPHHCVIRPDSTTTKLRVVFDASARTSSNKSLNDMMMVGPSTQSELFDIVIRFRFHRYVMTADIAKMYRQILVDPEDCNLQCILWRDHPSEEIRIYRLLTITYGTAAAPFLATRCLQVLADEKFTTFPVGSAVIRRDFYMDDLLTGAASLEEAIKIRKQVVEILRGGQLDLRKWYSNDNRILADLSQDSEEKIIQLQPSETTKTLGIVWGPVADTFSFYDYKLTSHSTSITKRVVLSDLARIYDPIGIINPVVVLGKIFLQELWIRKVNWDESLPQNLHTQWQRFRNDLGSLEQIQVPRFVLTDAAIATIEIHGFADASQRAYGACVYIRSTDIGGKSEIRLLCAKSRIAPVKTISLPKLELCAALLLAELIDRLRSTICITVHKVFCWTDSRIVLDWLSSHASNWNSFVSNRVAKIQEISAKISWNHVDSKNNPADIVSRGMLPEELAGSELWFQGPSFLRKPEEMWPKSKTLNISVADIPERRRSKFTFVATTLEKPASNNIVDADHFLLDIKYLNDFRKLQRIICFMFRFIQNIRRSRSRKPRMTEQFSTEELDTSLKWMVWAVQQTAFGTEVRDLERNSVISSKSCLRTLNPFLEDNSGVQLLRVGGRLQNADITYDAKHPILLPKSHPFVQSLVRYYHTKNFHAGTLALTAFVRQQYWVLNLRSIAKKVVFGCYRCFRSKPRLAEQIMGNLPAHRVTPARPFINSGVDFCGPFLIRHQLRGKHPYKIYVAVFVCFATKAIHMEIVSDLSSQAFIATLKRFVARRGHIRHLYCDNATNFVGARRELKELQEQFYKQETRDAIWRYCAEDGIDFHPIPARSPHFGGLWEAAVKSAKTLMFKTINMASLTYEELHTVIVQIEAILHSRPLTALSPDPADLEPLTPGHFLIGAPLTALVEPSLLDVNFSRLSRWQRICSLQQQFWVRWSLEYLHQLQNRYKWRTRSRKIQTGVLVLIVEDNLSPQKWLLGRVLEVHPDSEGVVRVVTLRTKNGVIRRCIQKICPLPRSDEE